MLEFSDFLLENEPSMYEPEYEDFLNSVKTSLMFNKWISEQDEEFLLEEYNIRPGELRAKLENIGRARARILFRNRIKDLKDAKNADLSTLTQLLGEKIALSVKKQLGQEHIEVPENKRKGQISLRDWEG